MSKALVVLTISETVKIMKVGSGASDVVERNLLTRFNLAPVAYVRGLTENKPCLRPLYLESDVQAALEKEEAAPKVKRDHRDDEIAELRQKMDALIESLKPKQLPF